MEELQKQVRRAQWLLGVGRFVGVLGWCWFGTLLAALVLIAVDKFWPLGVEAWIWGSGALGLGLLGAVGWAVVRGRGSVDAAIEIDHRFGLKERVSSTLAMSEEERASDVGQALIHDAVHRVERIDVGDGFSVSPGRQMWLPLAPVVAAVLVVWLVSPAVVENRADARDAARVKRQVRQSSETLKRKLIEKRKKAQKEALKDAQMLFQRLEEETEDLAEKTGGDRKQALVKLNDLYRQMEKRRQQLGGADGVQKQLEQLKQVGRGPADKFLKAVAQGDLKQAMRELGKLKSKVAQGQLSDEERAKLAKQLEEMKQKLQDMIDQQDQQRKDLANRIKQARDAGQDAEADKLQEQLDKLRQQLPQMDNLQDLANKLGQCAQCLKDGQLQDADSLLDQLQADLDGLQEQLQEMEMLDDVMEQLAQARDQMNCQECGGMGCGACQGDEPGMGLGEGRGKGDRPKEKTEVGFYDTKTPQKIGRGSATIAGEVDGPNVRGDVQQAFEDQLDAARAKAADPLTDLSMPRRHRQHAREYFDRFHESK